MNRIKQARTGLFISFIFISFVAHAATFTTVKSGSWFDPTVWSNGSVPATLDKVTISLGTTITVDGGPYSDCDSLTIDGFLDVGANNLTIGGRELFIDARAIRNTSCIINGRLRINGDWSHTFKIYGNVKFNAGSIFEMTAGTIMIDGCAFTEELSVPADKPLLEIANVASFNSTGGLIVLFNPHYHPQGLAIKGAKHFANVSFGNNLTLSTFAARSTSDFLISDTEKPAFDIVQLAYLPNPNRQNKVVLNDYSISNLTITNGVLAGSGRIKVSSNVLIGSNGVIESDLELNGFSDQNISTFQSNTSAIIKGNIYINNPTRVNTYLDLDFQGGTVQFIQGKFNLTNKTLKLSSSPLGGNASSYFITTDYLNNSGILVIKNLSGAMSFPVGTETDYLPVLVTASGGDFSVSAGPLSISTPNDQFAINKQWTINRLSGTAIAGVKVQWNAANENANFASLRSNSNLYGFNSGAWQAITSANATATESSSVFSKSVDNIPNFSIFTMITTTALPVSLLDFAGKMDNQNAFLTWKTASESNNQGFDVEKSADGIYFQKIGFVKGMGTSVQLNAYNFTDFNFNKTAYFRLKQMDFDGKFTYSAVVSLQKNKSKNSEINAFPNPNLSENVLNISFLEGATTNSQINIFDGLGRLVYQNQNLDSQYLLRIDVKNWANGLYLIQSKSDEKVEFKQFIKN